MSMIYEKYFPTLTKEQLTKFIDLKSACLDWNEKINVISRKDTDEFEVRHVLHALSIAKFIQFKPQSHILDFGTGGGFPGLPLAIFFPEVKFTLIDSIGKKMKVVEGVAKTLELKNVKCLTGRVETLEDKFDFITCRAVGRLSKILPWVQHSLKKKSNHDLPNGYIFLKGGDLDEELAESKLNHQRIPIQTYFEEVFFETKEIVYLPKSKY